MLFVDKSINNHLENFSSKILLASSDSATWQISINDMDFIDFVALFQYLTA